MGCDVLAPMPLGQSGNLFSGSTTCLTQATLDSILICRRPVGQNGDICSCFVGALPTRTLIGPAQVRGNPVQTLYSGTHATYAMPMPRRQRRGGFLRVDDFNEPCGAPLRNRPAG